jgi:hypothetical protein
VADFLAIRNPDSLIGSISGVLRQQVWANNSSKWAAGLSAREIECFEAYAGNELEQLGYPLTFRRRTRPMTRLESTCWRAQGAWRRLRNQRYWTDNWYKAQLRLRETTLPFRRPPAVADSRAPIDRPASGLRFWLVGTRKKSGNRQTA